VDRRQAGAECIVLHLIAGISRTVTAERPRWDMFPPPDISPGMIRVGGWG